MKKNVTWLLLALSLLFNIFFAAGYLRAQTIANLGDTVTSDDEMTRQVAKELSLTEDQTAVFRRLRGAMRDDAEQYAQQLDLMKQDLLAELDSEEPDTERVQELLASQVDLHRQRRLDASNRFGEFINELSPEQCHKVSERARRGRHGNGRYHDMMKRFDTDGDGQLDETESAARDASWNKRRQEDPRRWEGGRRGDGRRDLAGRDGPRRSLLMRGLLDRFDHNRDGVFDEAERAELITWLQQESPGQSEDGNEDGESGAGGSGGV